MTLLEDDFGRPDGELAGSGPGAGWVSPSGAGFWGVRSGRAQVLPTTTTTRLAWLVTPSPDHAVRTRLTRGASTSSGVAVRIVDAGTCVGMRVTAGGSWGLFYSVNGVTTVVAENLMPYAADEFVMLRAVGDTITVHDAAGTVRYTYSVLHSALRTGRAAGLRAAGAATNASYDDVRVHTVWERWNGTALADVTLDGVWNGAAVAPATVAP